MLRVTMALLLLLLLALTNCVRRDGLNPDCRWPAETAGPSPAAASHLIGDIELAEELSIRYMDAHHGPRSGHFVSQRAAGQARNSCLGSLFNKIGETHGVAPGDVFKLFGRRRPLVDLAIVFPFALLCAWAALILIRRLRGRYPPADGWAAAALVVLLSSLAFAAVTVLLGEQWSALAEMARVGNGHLSYRVDRLPWARHRGAYFLGALLLFLSMAAFRYLRAPRPRH